MAAAAAAAPTVAKSPPELVPPAGPTPGGALPLSSIDKTIRVSVNFIQVFPPAAGAGSGGGQDAAVAAMRDGFARALVPYYPIAGRIGEPTPGDLVVDCTDEGIWFVEAAAICALVGVNGLERPLLIPKEHLLPRPPPNEKLEDLILMAQVTKFICGGFAIGICFSHLVFDGQGATQFLKAAGEQPPRGPAPSVAPVWDRDAIPDPPKPPRGPLPSFTAFSFVTQVAEISSESIVRIKDEFKAATGGQACSTFDAVTAVVFKCRALAMALPDDGRAERTYGTSEKAMVVLGSLAGIAKGRDAVMETGRIPTLVETIKDGLAREEFAVVALLQLCSECPRNRALLAQEGAILPLVALSQSPSACTKHKTFVMWPRDSMCSFTGEYMKQPREYITKCYHMSNLT